MLLRGQICLPPDAPAPPPGAVLIVRVEDISEADAASKTLHVEELAVDHAGAFPFSFEIASIPQGTRCILSAMLLPKGAKQLAPTDYLTTRAYTIRPGASEQVFDRVELTRAA